MEQRAMEFTGVIFILSLSDPHKEQICPFRHPFVKCLPVLEGKTSATIVRRQVSNLVYTEYFKRPVLKLGHKVEINCYLQLCSCYCALASGCVVLKMPPVKHGN